MRSWERLDAVSNQMTEEEYDEFIGWMEDRGIDPGEVFEEYTPEEFDDLMEECFGVPKQKRAKIARELVRIARMLVAEPVDDTALYDDTDYDDLYEGCYDSEVYEEILECQQNHEYYAVATDGRPNGESMVVASGENLKDVMRKARWENRTDRLAERQFQTGWQSVSVYDYKGNIIAQY